MMKRLELYEKGYCFFFWIVLLEEVEVPFFSTCMCTTSRYLLVMDGLDLFLSFATGEKKIKISSCTVAHNDGDSLSFFSFFFLVVLSN